MPLFELQLNIPKEYKTIINKYIEILAIAIIYIVCADSDPKATLLDKTLYIILGYAFYFLIIKKVIKII
jgi:hypothetical protein